MVPPYHLEIWQIVAICLLMLPAFFVSNYFVVKKMVRERTAREERIDRFVAAAVGRDMNSANRFKKRPRRRF
jgi:hypothetical protein